MVISTSVWSTHSTTEVETLSQGRTSKLKTCLAQINRTLKERAFNLDSSEAAAIARLRQTLTQIEIAHIKKMALAEGIRDFYPTNQHIVRKMLSIARIEPHHYVLEPSAGAGDLASAIAQLGITKVDCFELHPMLQKAIKLQGFNLVGSDFLASTPQPIYHRIVANPPFSNNGVARHTQRAFKFLKPEGRLVTLAHHYKLRPSQSDRYFFAWLKSVNARFLNLGSAFAHSARPTQVLLQLIVIDRVD